MNEQHLQWRDDAKRREQLRIQALGAAISRRDWWAAERAYNEIRDAFDRPDIYGDPPPHS
ncbi:hypothetical protein [Bradyrhizobium icense]|uniref:hypothetical protein n=1 Tax=Bradyrhizobium icense TaxID=1274631 RepID=UPI0012E9EF9B|nr:hypothetical protein [Bradyrhizobium icense]